MPPTKAPTSDQPSAFDSQSGKVLWTYATNREFTSVSGRKAHGGSIESAGPVVANGYVLVNSGYLFGYSLTYDETGALSFFEQARIDGGAPAVFNAYPGGFGPSEFTEESRAKNTVTFANSAHDYPQRIVYTRKGSRMSATISLANGARAQTWDFKKC